MRETKDTWLDWIDALDRHLAAAETNAFVADAAEPSNLDTVQLGQAHADPVMPGHPRRKHRWALVAAGVVTALMLLCSCAAVIGGSGISDDVDIQAAAPVAQPEVEPETRFEEAVTELDVAPGVKGSGSEHVPEAGSDERAALMDAARAALGTTSQFEVFSLVSDGAWAMGVLKPVDSKTVHAVAYRNEIAGGWAVFWNGTPDEAAAAAAQTADGRFSAAVAEKVDYAARSVGDGERDAIAKEILSNFRKQMGSQYTNPKITHLQKTGNQWWAVGVHSGFADGGNWIAVQQRRGWWDIFDMGTEGPVDEGLRESLDERLISEMVKSGAVWDADPPDEP